MILSIDCGSTNFKAALFLQKDQNSLHRLTDASIPVPYLVYDHQRVELDPEIIWQLFLKLIVQVCDTGKVHSSQIKKIAITSQAQTFTILDSSMKPLLPLIGWADRRAASQGAKLQEIFGETFHQHCSFWQPFGSLTASKILWVRENHAEYLTSKNRVVTLPTFLAMRLAGVQVCDTNLAAMGGTYSLSLGKWWPQMCEAIGVTPGQLGQAVAGGQEIAPVQLTSQIELSPDVKIIMACNDQTSGAMGNDVQRGGAVVTLGTALVAYHHAGMSKGPFRPRGCWGPFPGGGYYELATRDGGCSTLDWADKQMHGKIDSPRFVALAQQACPTEHAGFFYPQFWGTERAWTAPEEDASLHARAVLEGITFSARQLVRDDLGIDTNHTQFHVIGGGSRLDAWLQMLADVLNAKVQRGQGDTLLGAARIAAGILINSPLNIDSDQQVPVFIADPRRVEWFDKRFNLWTAGNQTGD